MKKYILSLFLFVSFFSGAQDCSKSDLESAYGTVESHELNHQSGVFDMKIILTGIDTTNLIGWSLSDSLYTVSLLHGFTKNLIDSSDTSSIYFSLNYDTTNLPYYPKEFAITVNAINKYGDTFTITILPVVYFTLYGTTEIWDMEEFQNLPRKWLPKISPEPERVYVALSSIPTSTRPSLDSIHIQHEWQTDFALVYVENLPYAIEMAAYHPDTIALYAHLDSSYMDSNLVYKRHLFPQKFSGVIKGKIEFNYKNDVGDPVRIPLSGVNLKLVESDPMGRIANTFVTESSTDINGNFSLVYTNLWQRGAEGDEIELILRIESKNENYGIKVLRKDLYAVNRVLNIVKEDILFVLDPVGKNANVDLGTLLIDDHFTNEETKNYYKICSWAFMGYNFLEHQVHPNFMWRDLEIAFHKDNSDYLITTLGKGRIRLKPEARNHESTIWHEFGHFVMDRGMGSALMKGVAGDHSFHEEHNFHFAWSEGWANGFMAMLDVFYNKVDKETGTKRGTPIESRIKSMLNGTGFGNGIRSEYHIACAINDLYDGPTYFENNSTQPSRWNDDEALIGLNGDGYDADQIDNVSLSANDLVLAIEDQPKSIGEYYAVLMRKYSDCNLRKEIKRVFDQNRVVLNTANLKSTNDNEFSSDAIDMNHDMEEHLGFLNNIYTSFRTDIIELNDNFMSFNLGTETDKLTKSISDNIVINSATLFFNANRAIGFENNGWSGTTVLSNSMLTANVCADRVMVSNNGLIEVGDGNGLITSTTKILNNSVLEMNTNNSSQPATVRVNNNSKLVIEKGATLEIFPGSRIILNGDNAILEIKGNLIVNVGATFTFEGGSAGSGHVIFNIDKDDTPKDNITLEVDSKIKFVGNNSNDRVMEVPADAVFWLENPQASFEISNGFVALGRDALLNIAVPVTMNNVRYYAESGSKARSIVLWGHKHNILDVEIENIKEGLQSFNAVGGWPLKLNNVEISGADRGLLSEGKGATLTYFESEGNIMGIHISGSIWPNTFQNPKVTGAIRGTLFTGSSASNLVINKANYENNLEGVNYTGSGNLVLSCGKFHNIPGLSQPGNGITIKGGTVIAADALNYRAGRVSFAENKHTISLSDAKFYLNNGYNNLSFKNGNLALVGSSSFVTNYTGIIPAGYNLWDGSNVPSTLCLSPPGGYENYNATCLTRTGGFFTPICVSIPTSPIIDIYQFNNNQFDRCITNIAGNIPDKGTKNTGKMISTTRFVNKNLKDAVGVVLDTMNNPENRDYAGMIDYWAELLTEPEYEQPFSDEDYYYIDLMENKMMESLGLLLVNDSTLELSESGLGHFETVIEIQNHFIELLENDTTDAGVKLNNVFHFDLGTTYHLEGENELAYEQWNDMQSWANELYLEHTDYWLCQLAREELIKNCGNDPDSMDHIPVCQYEESEGSLVHLSIPGIPHNNLSGKVINIYPNPASSYANLELNSTKKGIATLFIHTLEGTCVKVVPGLNINFGTNIFELNTSELSKGIYLVTAQVNNSKWTGKLIIK